MHLCGHSPRKKNAFMPRKFENPVFFVFYVF